jgi:Xaa-Pro aminopeptidase
MDIPRTPTSAFVARRRALLDRLGGGAALIASGLPSSRNFPANRHPFRATSHFLYFFGASIPNAALLFADGEVTLFAPPPSADDALWHGPEPTLEEQTTARGLDASRPIDALGGAIRATNGAGRAVATLPTQDAASAAWLSTILDRAVAPGAGADLPEGSADAALAEAMIDLRLRHDSAAVAQLRAAAVASAGAHVAGMRATRAARTEAEVAGVMTGELRRNQLDDAYGPIVTVHGEILHNEHHRNAIKAGDLLLADVGGETPEGWAADITRVWPVAGVFSPTQRAIYEVVLAAQRAAIAMARKGTRYRALHEAAGRTIVEGLRALGIFRGDVDGLLERGAAAVFFPHGVGHLLGLDVHDMEDLGDRAGYAKGRPRSTRFGDCFLRLDRDLEPGMAVTIEPGFYQVPGILGDAERTGALGADLDRAVLAKFVDVRGIRIEDDVLITEGEPEVLTSAVPKDPAEVEAVMAGG